LRKSRKEILKRARKMLHNRSLNSETAHVGVSTFNNFSIHCSSVFALRAQFRLAQRYVLKYVRKD